MKLLKDDEVSLFLLNHKIKITHYYRRHEKKGETKGMTKLLNNDNRIPFFGFLLQDIKGNNIRRKCVWCSFSFENG